MIDPEMRIDSSLAQLANVEINLTESSKRETYFGKGSSFCGQSRPARPNKRYLRISWPTSCVPPFVSLVHRIGKIKEFFGTKARTIQVCSRMSLHQLPQRVSGPSRPSELSSYLARRASREQSESNLSSEDFSF